MPRPKTDACSITRIGDAATRSSCCTAGRSPPTPGTTAAMRLVEAGHRCIFPDRRGFGRSDQPWDGHDYDTYADDVAAVLEDAGIQRAGRRWSASRWAAARSRASSPSRARTASGRRCSSARSCPTCCRPTTIRTASRKSTFDDMTEEMKKDRAEFLQTFFKDFFGVGFVSLAGQRRGADERLAPGDDGRPEADPRRGQGVRDHRLPARPQELRRRADPLSSTAPATRPCRSTPPAGWLPRQVPGARLIEYDGSAARPFRDRQGPAYATT